MGQGNFQIRLSNPVAYKAIPSSTYNATLITSRRIHDGLAVFRIVPDGGPVPFTPGQYTVLALSDPAGKAPSSGRALPMIRRAYSFSCSLLDDQGQLRSASGFPYLEFYIALVPPHGDQPVLTPHLFALSPGDRLFVGRRAKGGYTLSGVNSTDNIVFIATGTAEAPHNAMLASLLSTQHEGRITVATCVRYAFDLAYLDVHRELERRYANYRYLPLATRESDGPSIVSAGVVVGRRLQDFFSSGDLERAADLRFDPTDTHVYLCGNPGMIGLPKRIAGGAWQFPDERGMIELLAARGFVLNRPGRRGNIHVERYW